MPQNLQSFNTFGFASVAQNFVCLTQADQLPQISEQIKQHGSYLILGGGSNVLLADSLRSLVVHMQIKGIALAKEDHDAYYVRAQGGEVWHDFVRFTLEQGWNGLENLALIPGNVGACPVQNIGAYGVEVMEYIHEVEVFHIPSVTFSKLSAAQCEFSYRDSLFKKNAGSDYIIVSVLFRLPKAKTWQPKLDYPDLKNYAGLGATPSAMAIFDAVCAIRSQKLPNPSVLGNAGSFFKNPVLTTDQWQEFQDKINRINLQTPSLRIPHYPQSDGTVKLSAGWLIDQAGWKGRRIGSVGVHAMQALVLVNYGGARAQDILALAHKIKIDIQHQFGVTLIQEPVNIEVG